MRAQVKTEFALAIIWAEAAIEKINREAEEKNDLKEEIEHHLHNMRVQHNHHWVSPKVYLISEKNILFRGFRVSMETIQMKNSLWKESISMKSTSTILVTFKFFEKWYF